MYTREQLLAMPNSRLVEIYNTFADRKLTVWKSGKDIIVQRILDHRGTVTTEVKPIDFSDAGPDDAERAVHGTVTGRFPPKPAAPAAKRARTIRDASLDLLCRVAYHEDKTKDPADDNRVEASHPKARSVGLTYQAILEEIRAEFKGCETSAECLRWYAVKVRVSERGYENLRLPQRRPRSSAS